VDAWPRHRRARFVHFVTGSDRLPAPGMAPPCYARVQGSGIKVLGSG